MKLILGAAIFAALISCTKKEASPTAAPLTGEALSSRGRTVYQTNCTACHNADPKKSGALGPDVAGSSRELIERRVIQGDYPAGYTPKRPSKVMVALPHLKNDVEALAAYLATP